MIRQLLLGTIVILITFVIHAWAFSWGTRMIERSYSSILNRYRRMGLRFLLSFGVLLVLLVITVDVWLWAFVLLAVHSLGTVEEAVYFALVSFTTLGFGDIILDREWRILSGLIAANGLISFGWSTAFMVDMVRRVNKDR